MKTASSYRIQALILATLVLFAGSVVSAETPVGSNVESRVLLGFKVNDDAVGKLVPDGWTALTLPQGPLAGTNLLVLFADRHIGLDPEGKPIDPYESRYAAIVTYGVRPDVKGPRMFVARTYEQPPVVDVYGNGVGAEITRTMSLAGSGHGARRHSEAWSVAPDGGGTITLDLSYDAGRPGWSSSEAQPYSAANPEFHRIYRYDQLAELAMSTALGKPLAGDIAFSAEGTDLGGIFDGTETMTAVMVIPVYVRNVSLP